MSCREYYYIGKCGAWIQEIFWIGTNISEGITKLEEYSSKDKDNYHTWGLKKHKDSSDSQDSDNELIRSMNPKGIIEDNYRKNINEKTFLREEFVDISESKYKDFTKSDFAILWTRMYGGVDGEHHKTWLFDQILRILGDTPIILKIASWSNGLTEERFSLGEPGKKYIQTVQSIKEEEGEYDCGIAP